jgi:WD40 repeat protein
MNKEPNDAAVIQLQQDLKRFATLHRGSEEALDALALRSRLPWPADTLLELENSATMLSVLNSSSSFQARVVGLLDSSPDKPSNVECLAFSPNGRHLACGRTDGTVQVWDLYGTLGFRCLGNHNKPVMLTAFGADSQSLTSVSAAKIALCDVATGAERSKIEAMKGRLCAAAQSSDGRTLACAFQEIYVSIYDVAEGQEKNQLSGFASAGKSLALTSTGEVLAAGGNEVELWNVPKSKKIGSFKNSSGIVALAFSDDDRWLSMVNKEGTGRVWLLGATQFSVNVESNCSLLVFSPLVRSVAAVVGGRTIRVIATASGEVHGEIELAQSFGIVRRLEFSPDGRHLAIANAAGTVAIVRLGGTPVAGETPK